MTFHLMKVVNNNVTIILDTNTKIKHLIAPTSGANVSLHDVSTDTNYQVPTGKKFRIFYIVLFDPNTTSKLESTTAADGTTGAVTILDPSTAGLDATIFISPDIAADLFLTVTTSSTVAAADIWGVEEDV